MATNTNPRLPSEPDPSVPPAAEGNEDGTGALAPPPGPPDNSRLMALAKAATELLRLQEQLPEQMPEQEPEQEPEEKLEQEPKPDGLNLLLQAAESLEDGNSSEPEKSPKVTARRAEKTKRTAIVTFYTTKTGRIKARREPHRPSTMVTFTSPWPPSAAKKTDNDIVMKEAGEEEKEFDDEKTDEEEVEIENEEQDEEM
ncbi:hypothetical protein MFIFM68171_06278 [Madurella fahalii]|uniref:Uncharacterized protein n=1 Tax=Madurella fahalii TaxID=1157608 RepID=A0ABQ0GE74_9PEZI